MTDLARLTLLCLRSLPYSAEPLADLRRWFDLCTRVLGAPYGSDAFYLLSRYILATTDPDLTELLAFARTLGPKAEELIMTGEQRLIAKGKAEGRAEGKAEGRAEGMAKAKAEVLLKLLGTRFGPLPSSSLTRIEHASLDELDRWVDRVLQAESLDEVFAR